ncbi:MAG: S46 family peptidase, partial [Salibacteraceae bacterium]
LNMKDMQKHGLKLTAEEIYSVNHSSLKDAIVMLSGGSCTAEIISKEGLTLTNHHCAFGAIQQNSTPEHDYLTDGFWAYSKDQELQAKGMTASFLERMEDVSEVINGQLTDEMSDQERNKVIAHLADSIENAATKDTGFNADVKSFYEGNEFYLFVYTTYTDVRLVGAPPSSVGKYGGDTDNWMWPRHTGDFSILRIYTGQDGKPSNYSADNKPLVPKHSLPISMDGVKENDYAMVMGYPGSTDRYLTSWGVQQAVDMEQPARVKIRGKKLDIYKKHMDKDAATRIKYASKYARVSNYWKYFIGQSAQLKKNHVFEKKQAIEADFAKFANSSEANTAKYGEALSLIEKAYKAQTPYVMASTYFNEAVVGSEILLFSYRANGLEKALTMGEPDPTKVDKLIQSMKKRSASHFKDYDLATDKEVTAAMLEMYYNDVPKDQQPQYFIDLVSKNKGDFTKMAEGLFEKSIFASQEKMDEFFVSSKQLKTLQKDPARKLMGALIAKYRESMGGEYAASYADLKKGNRLFVAGVRKMNPETKYAPNANSTMRLTYGKVLPYAPYDAVSYDYKSTLKGVMEKMDNNNPEFVVPQKLVDLYNDKNYGAYANADGTMPVCFLTNNDITGGNSGSPVINAKGELIGAAFDGNWEAMSGDIFFEQNIQRTIVVDIRYVLFIVDKYAGAKNLIQEMELVRTSSAIKSVQAEPTKAMEKTMEVAN